MPEAVTWHFAGHWDHMQQLVERHGGDLRSTFKISEEILSKCVSLPVSVHFDPEIGRKVKKILSFAFNKYNTEKVVQ